MDMDNEFYCLIDKNTDNNKKILGISKNENEYIIKDFTELTDHNIHNYMFVGNKPVIVCDTLYTRRNIAT